MRQHLNHQGDFHLTDSEQQALSWCQGWTVALAQVRGHGDWVHVLL